MSKKLFSDNNILISILSLELIALTLRDNIGIFSILLISQVSIFLIKLNTDAHLYKNDVQLGLPGMQRLHHFVHFFNHYILPLTQIIAVNLFLLTHQTYILYIFEIAFNILILSVVLKNVEAWFRNKYIIESQTHNVYDIISIFILFNSFWGGSTYLLTLITVPMTLLILFIFLLLSVVLTSIRYHQHYLSVINLLLILFNISMFFLGSYFFGTSIKFVLLITYSYYISLSVLEHYLNREFKWALVVEYAILTGIILVLMY